MTRDIAQSAEISVFHHALVGAAEEMGEVLKRSAFSPNIKERQDYSCALFDAKGRLLAQAAHLPVHLGSMPASVSAVVRSLGNRLTRGTFAVVNDPYDGGTHLPDITIVAPVFAGKRCIGFAANRAHHADIGGGAPGSMSPQTDVIAEGLVIPPMLLDETALALILANTRTPQERAGDIGAQMAACERGAARMVAIFGRELREFAGRCDALLEHSRSLMRHSFAKLKPGVYRTEDVMDDDGAGATDIPIKLKLTVARNRLTFDFTGSAPQVRGGINAVFAVTQSACYYAALCFCDPVPPVNAGCFECVRVIAPEGTIVNARRPAAVAGGNVETSQRIVDVCLSALSQAAGGEALRLCSGQAARRAKAR
jgi:N-methylhydantoinase B